MAGPTFFSSIRLFFHMLWASVVRVFALKKDVDVEPRDIEAGLQPSLPIKELPTDLNYELKPATCFLIPLKDGFVEIDLNTESTVASKRLTSTTTLSAESYVVDTSLKEAQDRVIDVLKSVIISPGIVTTTPCSAEVEYVNLRIVGTNGHIRMSKQSFAGLSVIQKAQFEPSEEDGSVESDSVKALILHRSATIRYVKRLPKYKLRAVQFALPPIEIPDVFSSRYAEPNRNSDLFDLLDQFPTPPPNVDPVLSPPTISPEKSGRFARRYCIYRKADAGDESISSSGGDATVLSISVSGDTLESSALDTPDSGNFSSVIPESFREEPDALLRHSRNLPQVLADLDNSPTKTTGSPAVLCKEDQRLSSAISKKCDSHDMSSRIGSGDDSDSTDEAAFTFPYHLRNILASSSSDDSDTTVDRLRVQLEELSFDSVKRPHSLVWFADRNFTKSPGARSSSGLLAKVNGKGQPDLVLTEGLHSRESLEDVLKVIRDAHVDDLDYRELFWRDSSFCRSSLAKRVTTRSSGAARNESLKPFSHSFESPDRSARDILAMLNLPDPTEAGADDSSWILSSEEMGTDILSPDEFLRRLAPNDDSFRDQGVHDLFTWLAAVDEDDQKADISISDDGDDQWHDAVLYLDASM